MTRADTNKDGKTDQKDEKEPIKWRVLSVDGNDMFLMADQILDIQPYHTKYASVTWENSSLRKWLNDTFYENTFTKEEKNAIKTVTVKNENNPRYVTSSDGGNDTEDNIYLLSIKEILNSDYGFDEDDTEKNTKAANLTEYALSIGKSINYGYYSWWLRSPGSLKIYAARVNVDGTISYAGNSVDANITGVRPVLHIDLASTTWSNAGTVKSDNGDTAPAQSPLPAATATASPVPTLPVSLLPTVNPNLSSSQSPTPTVSPSNDLTTSLNEETSNTSDDDSVANSSDIYNLKVVVRKGQKKISLSWKKIKKATGYQIRYTTDKNLKKKLNYKVNPHAPQTWHHHK